MEDRRRGKWENFRRPPRGRPPRGSWQPAVPSWEKQFCREIGSIEWETLLQMKKFIHLYADILNWDDSAGKEAFYNAKERFWAELNGLPCEIPLPDPDLYIDEINSENSEINLDEFESRKHVQQQQQEIIRDESHEPVVIFGDTLLPTVAYSGWSDEEDTPVDAPDRTRDIWDWNYEQVPSSTSYRASADEETRRKQEQQQGYTNQFPRRQHHRAAEYWGQLHPADKRTDQRV